MDGSAHLSTWIGGLGDLPFREIWAVDTEYIANAGERLEPVCLVARELREDRIIRIWRDELRSMSEPPYPTGPDSLFIAYYASAELGCHLTLGWPMPVRVLDLFVEFRNATNGRPLRHGNGLLGALAYHGLDAMSGAEKTEMRNLIMGGGPWSVADQVAILDYCQTDVDALVRLLPRMLPRIDLPRAILRGRSMAAAAHIEHAGVPIDTVMLDQLRQHWDRIKDRLIAEIDADYGVYDGRTFKRDRFERWLTRQGLPWPRLPTGALDMSDEAFRQMARAHPIVAPLRELRNSLAKLRLNALAVGADDRNRTMLSAFQATTGRNQPSNSRFIFGPSAWLRGLIKPPVGWGLAYIDWSQQEFGIAAALSGDPLMIQAYLSGDPYLAFAVQAGAVPADATKESHEAERDQFKACALAVQYGMGAASLAACIGQPTAQARYLLELHHLTYRVFWRWSDAAVDFALLTGQLHTVLGWTIHVEPEANARSLRNFPMQANGAELLRLACSLATERGIEVCAPIHDAVLIAAPLERLDADIAGMQAAMLEASRIVLNGFELRADAEVVRWPDRYMNKRGSVMWNKIMALLDELDSQE
jgi:DNA polymerase I